MNEKYASTYFYVIISDGEKFIFFELSKLGYYFKIEISLL